MTTRSTTRSKFPIIMLLFLVWIGTQSYSAFAQAPQATNSTSTVDLNPIVSPDEVAALQEAAKNPQPVEAKPAGIDALNLLLQGGWVMIPLAIVSLLVLMWSLERLFSLRKARILPRSFVQPLTQYIRQSDVLPVQDAYRLCVQHPSVASNVVATTLIRTGRPLPEIEKTASEAIQREVDTATGPIRWLAFLAGIAPLLGLLGTVSGLIQAFYATTQLDPTQNRAEALATGIYEALVTTLVGLMIAIPAAAAAQYFENRVLRQFRRIEDLIAMLLPRLESFENRVRFDPIGNELVARNVQPPPKQESLESRTIRGTIVTPPSTPLNASSADAALAKGDGSSSTTSRRTTGTSRPGDKAPSRRPLP